MQRREFLLASAATVAASVLAPAAFAVDANYKNHHLLVEAENLVAQLDGDTDALRLIDVRSEAAYAEGHIPGAISIPFTALTEFEGHVPGGLKSDRDIADLLGQAGINAGSEVVLYDDQGGFRAARLFWLLEYFGHRDAKLLNGGLQAWTAAGLPLDAQKGVGMASAAPGDGYPGATRFPIAKTPRRHASADWIMARRDDRNVVVVDVRPTPMFEAGHIPWAINAPWKGNLSADGKMKAPAALAAHFSSFGITPDKQIAIHCQTGEASAHSYFALRLLGYPQVRVYHRSWAEWGAADDLPKAAVRDAS